ncbi:uncharacterized protein BDZ99DRAFT_493153 [Mytilinidion resinicola]|uniref:Uncharacterized protein n=1 Tax=Mytilinidion resinicola TaxID=574789 RepID=A0A6A6Z9D2_9PEZI|nr:uncharacterized protein BDZ99DRAFT_493153 [Mytilinidion resinicola]KAF2817309.1 hypothetical protein BDZ99DRAFT_493153 [Mytilinidion resinicola]
MQSKTKHECGRWSVENWQIPVPLGDCSVHLLVDRWVNTNGFQVAKAFIMDGGKNADTYKACDQILKALDAIDKFVGNTSWKFDVPRLYCGAAIPSAKNVPVFDIENSKFVGTAGQVLIGRDIFTGSQMFDIEGDNKTIIRSSNEDPDQPRFCVVGANNYGVGSKEPINRKKPSKNATSILAILYWPGKGGGRCSYFTGGDGNPRVETERVAVTLATNQRLNRLQREFQLPQLPLTMMKLDHHGSSHENLSEESLEMTPLALLYPKHVLVTPGNQYGHPTWDVLKFVKERMGKVGGKLYTTRSPYWVTKDEHTTKDINVSHYGFIMPMINKELELWHKIGDKNVTPEALEALGVTQVMIDQFEHNKARAELQDQLEKDGKMVGKKQKWQVVSKEIIDMENLTKTDLARALVDPEKEEPEMSKLERARLIMKQNREDIQDSAFAAWESICEQPIIFDGNPFFLVRFYFSHYGFDNAVEVKGDDGTSKTFVLDDGKNTVNLHKSAHLFLFLDSIDHENGLADYKKWCEEQEALVAQPKMEHAELINALEVLQLEKKKLQMTLHQLGDEEDEELQPEEKKMLVEEPPSKEDGAGELYHRVESKLLAMFENPVRVEKEALDLDAIQQHQKENYLQSLPERKVPTDKLKKLSELKPEDMKRDQWLDKIEYLSKLPKQTPKQQEELAKLKDREWIFHLDRLVAERAEKLQRQEQYEAELLRFLNKDAYQPDSALGKGARARHGDEDDKKKKTKRSIG